MHVYIYIYIYMLPDLIYIFRPQDQKRVQNNFTSLVIC